MLCETWVTSQTKNLINIPGYDFVGIERMDRKGGGVGILISKNLHYKKRTEFDCIEKHLESIFVELTTKGRNILCGSLYHPPNTDVKEFHKEITNIMGRIKLETQKDSIIGMDHNLDLIKLSLYESTENFINTMLDHSSFPCITRPT